MNDSHGTEGPMHVSYAGNKNKLGTEYLQSAKGLGYESAVDLQSFTEESIKKVGKWEKWVDPGTEQEVMLQQAMFIPSSLPRKAACTCCFGRKFLESYLREPQPWEQNTLQSTLNSLAFVLTEVSTSATMSIKPPIPSKQGN